MKVVKDKQTDLVEPSSSELPETQEGNYVEAKFTAEEANMIRRALSGLNKGLQQNVESSRQGGWVPIAEVWQTQLDISESALNKLK